MKVLYLPIYSQPGTEDGFRGVGVNLKIFDFLAFNDRYKNKKATEDEFIKIAKQFKPDLIHMQLQMTNLISPTCLMEIRKSLPETIMTNWTGDIRKVPNNYFINISKVVDYSLLSNVGQIDKYRKKGCKNPVYWQIGMDPKECYNLGKSNNFKYDVSFVANSYPNNTFPGAGLRREIAIKLKGAFGDRCGVFGNGWNRKIGSGTLPRKKVNGIYNDSLTVLSVSNFNDVSHYFSDRLLMCMGSGRPTISYTFPSYSTYFSDRSEIFMAASVKDIISIVNECKNKVEFANEVGRNGMLKVIAEHSFTSRIAELIKMVGLEDRL